MWCVVCGAWCGVCFALCVVCVEGNHPKANEAGNSSGSRKVQFTKDIGKEPLKLKAAATWKTRCASKYPPPI